MASVFVLQFYSRFLEIHQPDNVPDSGNIEKNICGKIFILSIYYILTMTKGHLTNGNIFWTRLTEIKSRHNV